MLTNAQQPHANPLDQALIRHPLTVAPDLPLVEAIALMSQGWGSSCCRDTRELEIPATADPGCALVVKDAQLAGLLSEQEVLRLVALENHWQNMKVAHAMTRPAATLKASEFLNGLPALRLMQQHGIDHLPILDDKEHPLGIVTLTSLMQALNLVQMLPINAQSQPQSWQLTAKNGEAMPSHIAEHDQRQQERAEELKAQVERGNLLAAVAQRIRSSLNLGEVLNAAVAEVRQLLQADRVLIYQFAPDMSGEIMTESVGSDWTACLHTQIRDRCFPEGVAEKYCQGHRWVCPNIYAAGLSECHLQLLEQFEVKANLVVPILIGDHLWGLLVAHQCSSPRYWKASELELLDQLSVHLAIAIQQATAFEQAQQELAERRQIEASLRRAYQQLTFHVENTPLAVIEWDREMRVSRWSSQAERIFGWRASEVLGKRLYDWQFIFEDDREAVRRVNDRLLDGRDSRNLCRNRNYNKAGAVLHCEWYNSVLRDDSGEVVSILSLAQDVTLRKQAEQKNREQAALLDVATDAILVHDLDNCISYWNKGAERLYGWTIQEALGQNVEQLLYQKPYPQLEQVRQEFAQHGEWQGELNQVSKSGQELIVESRWTLVRDDAGNPKSILMVNTDITAKKQLEAQFLRAQRLESIGTLAGGIAHDLNNILTPILMGTQLLQSKYPQADKRTEQLFQILESNARRGAALVKQVLWFSRGVQGERVALEVKHLIVEIKQIIQETFPKSIDVRLDIPKNLWLVRGDATQLHQVLMNLCVNARDAMPNGGTLSMRAENIMIDENYARMDLDAEAGAYVAITVADTGVGIAPEQLDRIFEPFFTTKEPGKGTGLGLSAVMGIVKSHGGFIKVTSSPREGTQFKVFLPALQAPAEIALEKPPELPRGQGELILVVDDEVQVCEVTATTLESYGYRVLTAHNGIEAIALYAQHQQEIDLVLMDLMMPSMNGGTAIRILREMNPQVKAIAISGQSTNEQVDQATNAKVEAFLSKPYSSEDLLTELRNVLDS